MYIEIQFGKMVENFELRGKKTDDGENERAKRDDKDEQRESENGKARGKKVYGIGKWNGN